MSLHLRVEPISSGGPLFVYIFQANPPSPPAIHVLSAFDTSVFKLYTCGLWLFVSYIWPDVWSVNEASIILLPKSSTKFV